MSHKQTIKSGDLNNKNLIYRDEQTSLKVNCLRQVIPRIESGNVVVQHRNPAF